jgi:hypothetical protein
MNVQNQSLVALIVIDALFNREYYDSILCNCDREGVETTYARTDPQPDWEIKWLGYWW